MKKITLKKITTTFIILLFTTVMFSQTTIVTPITVTDADDAEERISDGVMDITSSDLEFCADDDGDQLVGIRFQNVNVPQGAVISNAYIQFEVDEVINPGAVTIDIEGIDVDNASQFSTSNFNISQRINGTISSGTSATVSWSPAEWTSEGANQQTTNLSNIVKEIVDRGGWSFGNDMAFVFSPNSGSPARRYAEDSDTAGQGAVLYVTYILASGPTEIDVTGNGTSITDGDTTPDAADDTQFGSVPVAETINRTFTISNSGAVNLNLSGSPIVAISGDTQFEVTTQPSASLISGGGSLTFVVSFTPTVVSSTYDATISIANDDSDENPYTFDIQGIGTSYPSTIIPGDTFWNYLDDGSNQGAGGAGWTAIAFDDSSWETGQAELGYGDGDEATDIGQPAEPRPLTTYFRKYIGITDASAFNSIDLGAIRDDAMVVYLNGTEIWRDNISADPVAYDDPSDDDVNNVGNEAIWIYTNIASTALVTGTNVIAVEIHQRNDVSSDISFDFEFTPSIVAPGATQVERGPYLQSGTTTSVIVKWRTDVSSLSTVNYGTTLGALSSSVSDGSATTEHEVTLTGLTANTTYYYEIEDAIGTYVAEDSQMYIKTHPLTGTRQFVRAWILGDPGTANADQRNVRDAYYNYIAGTGPTGSVTNTGQSDMILFLGDNAYNNGTDLEYQSALFDVYDDMLKKSVAWSTLGNHDGYSVDFNTKLGPYYDIFSFPIAAEAGGLASGTEEYYSYDYGNIHFIVLQSNNVDGGGTEATFNTAQKAWLTSDIGSTTQDWIVAFFHHPPYTNGSHDSDNDSENGLQTMREQYIPILEAGGVDLILNGHSHSYERTYFIKDHTGYSNTFNISEVGSGGHTVGANGSLSGRDDIADGAYQKISADGAVYITAGSSGKINAVTKRNPSYIALSQLGSCVLEIEDDGLGGQNMNIKFIRETGAVDDYFTINKEATVLATETNNIDNDVIMVYPVPTHDVLNIKLKNSETLQKVTFYNAIGAVAKVSNKEAIDVSNLKTGVYMLEITTDVKSYFKTVIIE